MEITAIIIFLLSFERHKKHYETVCTQFQRWCNKKIFKNTLDSVIPYENTLFIDKQLTNTSDQFTDEIYIIDVVKDYFIDLSNIANLMGSENLIINPELKKKRKSQKLLKFLILMDLLCKCPLIHPCIKKLFTMLKNSNKYC